MSKNLFEVSKPDNLSFFVGDIHGQYDLLMESLDDAGFEPKKGHFLFSVGDLIDRGPQNMECLSLLDEPWFFAVRGNHEDFMIKTVLHNCQESEEIWAYNGGAWAGEHMENDDPDKRFSDELIYYANKLNDIPYLREVHTCMEGQKIIVVHAELPRNFDYKDAARNNIKAEDLEALIWKRTLATQARFRSEVIKDDDEHLFVRPSQKLDIPSSEIKADAIISGHTPKRTPMVVGRNLFIDTGAASGKKPTVLNETEIKNILRSYNQLIMVEQGIKQDTGSLGL